VQEEEPWVEQAVAAAAWEQRLAEQPRPAQLGAVAPADGAVAALFP